MKPEGRRSSARRPSSSPGQQQQQQQQQLGNSTSSPASRGGGGTSSGAGGSSRRTKSSKRRHEEEKKDEFYAATATSSSNDIAVEQDRETSGAYFTNSDTGTSVMESIRLSLDESTGCSVSSSAEGHGKSAGKGGGDIVSCPAGYLSYSGYQRRWEVHYRNLRNTAASSAFSSSSSGGSGGSKPQVLAYVHRVNVSSSTAAGAGSPKKTRRGSRGKRRGKGRQRPASPSDYRKGGDATSRSSNPNTRNPGPPPREALVSTLRLLELRRLFELVQLDRPTMHTRQGTTVSLQAVFADLNRLEGGQPPRKMPSSHSDATVVSVAVGARYVKLLRSAASEAISAELIVVDDGGDGHGGEEKTSTWRVSLSDGYVKTLGGGGELSPSSCGCNEAQISYAQRLIRDCLALDLGLTVENDAEDGVGEEDGDDVREVVALLPALVLPAAPAPSPAPVPVPAPSGRRPKRMRENARRSSPISAPVPAPPPPPDSVQMPDDGNGHDVPLFASNFASPKEDDGRCSDGRPKRKLKQVMRYDANPLPYKLELEKSAAIGRAGGGFSCPRCAYLCSYDVQQCPTCHLNCQYAPGYGVQIVKERNEVTTDASAKWESQKMKSEYGIEDDKNADTGDTKKIEPRPKRSRSKAKAVQDDNERTSKAVATEDNKKIESSSRPIRRRSASSEDESAGEEGAIEDDKKTASSSRPKRDRSRWSKDDTSTTQEAATKDDQKTSSNSRPKRDRSKSKFAAAPVELTNQSRRESKRQKTTTKSKVGSKVALPAPKKNPPSKFTAGGYANLPEIVECEACLKLFSHSSIQGHRRRIHGLTVSTFKCPHCDKKFDSKEKRHAHIVSGHPGKASRLSAKIKAQHKIFTYLCPCCGDPFNLINLQNHLWDVHSKTVEEMRLDIIWLCPFCPISEKKRNRFRDQRSLKEHVDENHKHCRLLGSTLYIPEDGRRHSSKDRRSRPSNRNMQSGHGTSFAFGKGGVTQKGQANNLDNRANEDAVAIEPPFDLHQLSAWPVVAQNTTSIAKQLQRGNLSEGEMLVKVNSKIESLEQNIESAKLPEKDRPDNYEKEYIDEMKLYGRTVRERRVKEESERLEKEKFKEVCNERHMVWEYENRGKKKSPADVEEEAFLSRPLRFVSKPAAASTGGQQGRTCCIGDGCHLCDGSYAQHLVTEAELNEAKGDIQKVLPLPLNATKAKASEGQMLTPMGEMLMPMIREIPSDEEMADSDDDDDDEEEDSGEQKQEDEARPSRRRQKVEESQQEIKELTQLKHTLSFVESYNQGLLPALKRNPKDY